MPRHECEQCGFGHRSDRGLIDVGETYLCAWCLAEIESEDDDGDAE